METEIEEQNRTLRLRKKKQKILLKFPQILGQTLKLRLSWLLARVKKMGNKPYYQRMLIEEDEIVVLQGVIDFKLKKGKSLYDDEKGFYDFVKRSLNVKVSLYQLTEKVKSLKRKYMGKWKNGVEPSFRKAHDQKCFELAKFIWGSNGMALVENRPRL